MAGCSLSRNGELKAIGDAAAVAKAKSVFVQLAELSKRGNIITEQNVNYAISLCFEGKEEKIVEIDGDLICHTIQGRPIKPKTLGQKNYIQNIRDKMITFGIGPAGTGKTYLAMAMAINAFKNDEVRIDKNDQVVLLEEDDGAYDCHTAKKVDESKICNGASISAQASNHLIVLGSNEKLPIILAEYAKYVQPGTHVVVVDDDLDETKLGTYDNLEIKVCTKPVTRDLLCEFLDENANNILLLNDDSQEPEASDSQTLLRLILLRDIADKTDRHFAITTEMRSVDNQRLASQARVDDFVIGSNFASLLMAQISENPNMAPLITDLLDESGSELYMKPAANYVSIGVPVDSYTLTESAARKGEIYVGYRHIGKTKTNVVVNPNKEEMITFGDHDQIVVIAEN